MAPQGLTSDSLASVLSFPSSSIVGVVTSSKPFGSIIDGIEADCSLEWTALSGEGEVGGRGKAVDAMRVSLIQRFGLSHTSSAREL
jgi:hypothetical protein